MSATRRRGLRVDDPLGAGDERADDASLGGESADAARLRDIPLGEIHANPEQPRKRFEEGALSSLADSIRERGVLQPIIVRPAEHGYELVAGERRWRAAELAGEATIPALVDDALDEAGSLELALIENVVREDLTAIEQARTLSVLLEDLRMTGAVLAKRLGRSRADIANTIRLLDLPDEAIELIDSGALSKGHGRRCSSSPTITAAASSAAGPSRLAGRCAYWKLRSFARRSRGRRGESPIRTTARPRRTSRTRSCTRSAAMPAPPRTARVSRSSSTNPQRSA